MNEIYRHMNPALEPETIHDRFFLAAALPFEKSKEEVWESLSEKLMERPPARIVRFRTYRLQAAAAAMIVLLVSVFLVMRYYTVSINSAHGEFQTAQLPGGSIAELNAGSRLSYHPLWWEIKRIVRIEGEGYFEVAKGKEFQVRSENGFTEVLGTTFTIYARPDEYRVTCFTGSVKVVSGTGQEAILSPDYQARIGSEGHIIVSREKMPEIVNSWITGMFSFTAHPLRLVLDEIERQYDVRIIFQPQREYLYTGHFSKEKPVGEVMELIVKPFGLNFVQRSERSFEVLPN
jgi:ferric-dicitrate binding protein FerR (iron transport regulator)